MEHSICFNNQQFQLNLSAIVLSNTEISKIKSSFEQHGIKPTPDNGWERPCGIPFRSQQGVSLKYCIGNGFVTYSFKVIRFPSPVGTEVYSINLRPRNPTDTRSALAKRLGIKKTIKK